MGGCKQPSEQAPFFPYRFVFFQLVNCYSETLNLLIFGFECLVRARVSLLLFLCLCDSAQVKARDGKTKARPAAFLLLSVFAFSTL